MTKPYGKIYQHENNVSITPTDVYNLYPIGSIYLSVNSTNPSNYFGGTWEQIEDRFLIGAGNLYNSGAIGGEASVKLSVSNLPEHSHSGTTNVDGHHRHDIAYYAADAVQATNNDYIGNSGMGWSTHYRLNEWLTFDGNNKSAHSHSFTTNNTGSNTAHNNMPPYLAVYMWKRIA